MVHAEMAVRNEVHVSFQDLIDISVLVQHSKAGYGT
jgi:hypothetical protein